MRILGSTAQLANSSGQSSRRNVNIILVLDRSGSMWGAPCAAMITASKHFANMFVNGRDRLGMVSFGSHVSRDYLPTTDFKNPASPINAAIDAITCVQATNTSDGYSEAYQQLVDINQPLALNIILLFTDGLPNVFSANFPVMTHPNNRASRSCPGGGTCETPKSRCRDDNGRDGNHPQWGTFNPRRGALAWSGGLWQSPVTRPTDPISLIDASLRVGCETATRSDTRAVASDYAYIPDEDVYGVGTSGYMDAFVERFPAGSPYAGKIRIDRGLNVVAAVGYNLCDNAARRARNHPTLQIITYSIGLGSVDHDLLRRMANDLTSPTYDNTKLNGLYVFAPTIAEIGDAYARIAAEVLRLAK